MLSRDGLELIDLIATHEGTDALGTDALAVSDSGDPCSLRRPPLPPHNYTANRLQRSLNPMYVHMARSLPRYHNSNPDTHIPQEIYPVPPPFAAHKT